MLFEDTVGNGRVVKDLGHYPAWSSSALRLPIVMSLRACTGAVSDGAHFG